MVSRRAQVLLVVRVDALDIGVGFGERDGFGEGVDVARAGGQEPAVDGEVWGVVGGQRGENTVVVPRQALAEGEGAEGDAGAGSKQVRADEAILPQRSRGVVPGAGDGWLRPRAWAALSTAWSILLSCSMRLANSSGSVCSCCAAWASTRDSVTGTPGDEVRPGRS